MNYGSQPMDKKLLQSISKLHGPRNNINIDM